MGIPPGPYRTSATVEPPSNPLSSDYIQGGSVLVLLTMSVRPKGWLGRLFCLHTSWIPYYGVAGPPPQPFSRSWQCVSCGKIVNRPYHDEPISMLD